MPSPKTMTTELAVAFGMLEREPKLVSESELASLFRNDSLKPEILNNFKSKFYTDSKAKSRLHRKLFSIGMQLRTRYEPFKYLDSVEWYGPTTPSKALVTPKDIIAANIPVSVKADSDIVFNLAPYKLLVGLPSTTASPSRTPNWYLYIAPDEYQNLYAFARENLGGSYPELATQYHKHGRVKPADKLEFAKGIKQLPYDRAVEFTDRYVSFCRLVATRTAERFNALFEECRNGLLGRQLIANVYKHFLRVSETAYVLCGVDGNSEYAVEVPDLTAVERGWKFRSLTAYPDMSAGQSKVLFDLVIAKSGKSSEYKLSYWTEIRWSHRKFVRNPESKLYKSFDWSGIPFFRQIYVPGRVTKLAPLGGGSFGAVYIANLVGMIEPVALKEMRLDSPMSDSTKRELRLRFQREVLVQSGLKHLNILPILDYELDDLVPWFATELAPTSLSNKLPEIKGDLCRIARMFVQILESVRFAHSHGIIHRDIKPANIFVFDKDLVKVGDFGLGKSLRNIEDNISASLSEDAAMGSIPYAAPEQLESFSNADYRSDIHALGVTLYAMILGRELSTTTGIDTIDCPYRAYMAKCTAADPDARFQTTQDAMDQFLEIKI